MATDFLSLCFVLPASRAPLPPLLVLYFCALDFNAGRRLHVLQELLANAEARLAGVRAKSGWGARFGSFLAGSFVTRIVRKLSVTVSGIR